LPAIPYPSILAIADCAAPALGPPGQFGGLRNKRNNQKNTDFGGKGSLHMVTKELFIE